MALLDSGQHRPYHWGQPYLHFTHAGKQASWPHFQENQKWIFMYNLLLLMLATNFFPEKTVGMKSLQRCAGISFQSMQVFISGLELGVQWGQRGI